MVEEEEDYSSARIEVKEDEARACIIMRGRAIDLADA
jgi:hypothetical protein